MYILTLFNFKIKYYLRKSNLINMLLKRLDIKSEILLKTNLLNTLYNKVI